MMERGAGMTEGAGAMEVWRRDRVAARLVRWLAAFPPHLTSPLEGGRDELGELGKEEGGCCGRVVGAAGCPRGARV